MFHRCIFAIAIMLCWSLAMADDTGLEERFAAAFARSGLVAAGFGVQMPDGPPQIMVAGTTAKGASAPVPLDAPWHIGSITKTFTSVLVMMAVADGQLSLDAPLVTLLPDQAPDMDPSWHDVTLRQMLSHTAGLRPNPARQLMGALHEGTTGVDALLADQWAAPLPGTPGQFAYSNIGYILAAYVYEAVTGIGWEDALRDRIVVPLGLTSFGIGPPDVIQGHRSYFGFGARPVDPATVGADNPPVFTPAGRMHLSVADALGWGRFLLDACKGRSPLLSADACTEMITPVTGQYGLGIAAFPLEGTAGGAWGHDGSNTMWYALLAVLPEEEVVAFVVASQPRPQKVSELGAVMLQAAMAP